MSNQVSKALSSGEHARTPNGPGGHDVIMTPDVARSYEITAADYLLDDWRRTFDPQPMAAAVMSAQVEAQPHATTTNAQFEEIMGANVENGAFDPGYIDAISGDQLGATMSADTPRPNPVDVQSNFQPYQGA